MSFGETFSTYIPEASKRSMTTEYNNRASNNKKTNDKSNNAKEDNKNHYESEALAKVKQYKEGIEANIVGCLYKDSELFLDCNLAINDFSYNSWRCFFVIANSLYINKKTITEDNIEFYLKQHTKLAEQYNFYKGWTTMQRVVGAVKIDDFEGYIAELNKWNAVIKVASRGFPLDDYLSDFADMSAEQIYDLYTAFLNDSFISIDEKIKSYDAFDGLTELNEECDQGVEQGLMMGKYADVDSCPILNGVVNGFSVKGNIYGLGAASGVGKSTMAINYIFPLVLENQEPAVFLINEEDQKKFQKEAETWVINNVILKEEPEKYFNKKRFREGNFSSEEKCWLNAAVKFLSSWKEKHLITVIPMERYTSSLTIKIIKKYAKFFDVKIFVLDTLKESYDSRANVDTWKSMERDMVDYYNIIKPTALNVGLLVTYQLGKTAIKTRYLTNAEIGQARNIVDVMSVNIMMRRPFPDEFDGGKKAIKVKKSNISNANEPDIDDALEMDKRYMVTFITKNRFGDTDPFQIVSACDFGTDIVREIGRCYVSQDYGI